MRPGPYFFALGLVVGAVAASLFWGQKSSREAEDARQAEAKEWADDLGTCKAEVHRLTGKW